MFLFFYGKLYVPECGLFFQENEQTPKLDKQQIVFQIFVQIAICWLLEELRFNNSCYQQIAVMCLISLTDGDGMILPQQCCHSSMGSMLTSKSRFITRILCSLQSTLEETSARSFPLPWISRPFFVLRVTGPFQWFHFCFPLFSCNFTDYVPLFESGQLTRNPTYNQRIQYEQNFALIIHKHEHFKTFFAHFLLDEGFTVA